MGDILRTLQDCYSGVRSGMATPQEGDAEDPLSSRESVRAVRMSLRPPVRFSAMGDLALWLTRFEMYVRRAGIPEDQWTSELLPLLEDEPFRLVSQQGLVQSSDYKEVADCLRAQYEPEGNELEWLMKFQQHSQKAGEQLGEYVGALRVLVDKAYSKWDNERRKELVRNQFIHGIHSSTVQLRLMREMPSDLDDTLTLAMQQEAVEAAQRRISKKEPHETLTVGDNTGGASCNQDNEQCVSAVSPSPAIVQLTKKVQESEAMVLQLTRQVQLLQNELSKSAPRNLGRRQQRVGEPQKRGPRCWSCGGHGHLRRDCPSKSNRKQDSVESAAVSSALMVRGVIGGRPTKMLVDSGSAVILIREDVWEGINTGQALETPVCTVVAANGEKLKLVGQCNLPVQVGGLSHDHPFLIVKSSGLTQECLLGADYLTEYGCVIDLKHQILLAGGTPVHFIHSLGLNGEDSVMHTAVKLSESVTLPSYCQMQLPVIIASHSLLGSTTALLEPDQAFMEAHGQQLLF